MNLGNKIMSLRKMNNLSQEELAEKVGVTRQTISKWELEETAPDINQAVILSKIFKVSLDDLTNNDVSNVLVEKVSNTEKLAGIIIKILKVFGVFLIAFFVINIFILIFFNVYKTDSGDRDVIGEYTITCKLDDEEYLYGVEFNKNYQAINIGGDAFISNHIDLIKYDDANQIIAHIEDYFNEHDGTCETVETRK